MSVRPEDHAHAASGGAGTPAPPTSDVQTFTIEDLCFALGVIHAAVQNCSAFKAEFKEYTQTVMNMALSVFKQPNGDGVGRDPRPPQNPDAVPGTTP